MYSGCIQFLALEAEVRTRNVQSVPSGPFWMASYYLGQLQWTAPAQLLCLCDEIWVFEIKNGPTHQKWEQSFGYRQKLGCSQVITCTAGSGVISFHYNVDEKRKLILGQDRCVHSVRTFCPCLRGFSLGLQFLPHPTDVHIRGIGESKFTQSEWVWVYPASRELVPPVPWAGGRGSGHPRPWIEIVGWKNNFLTCFY